MNKARLSDLYKKVVLAKVAIVQYSTTPLCQSEDLIIHQPDSVLDNMGEWCKEQHGKVTNMADL